MSKQDRPSIFVVGTHNANGEEYSLCPSSVEAEARVRELVEDGFRLDEIVCIEGFRREVHAETEMIIHKVRFT